jgi:hypothetical protein
MVVTKTEDLRIIELNPDQEPPDGAESLNVKVRTEVEKQLSNLPTYMDEVSKRLSVLDNLPELISQLYVKLDVNDRNQERMIKSSELVADGVVAIVEQNKKANEQNQKSNEINEKLLIVLGESFKLQDKNEERAVHIDKRADDKVSSETFQELQKSSATSLASSQRNTFISNVALVVTVLMFAAFVTGISLKGKIPGWGEAELSPAAAREVAQVTAQVAAHEAKQAMEAEVKKEAEATRMELKMFIAEAVKGKNASN